MNRKQDSQGIVSKDWLIDFNGMSTCLELFYTKGIVFIVHLYLHFLCSFFSRGFQINWYG